MKNPKINRTIGYIILFSGFGFFYKGLHSGTLEDGINSMNLLLVIIAIVFIVFSIIWMILKVRCPHCNRLLNLKLWNIDYCPFCGKRTDE